jgi:GTP-binding protein
MVETYLNSRPSLAGMVLICDIRRPAEEEEREILSAMGRRGVPVVVAATKADKLSANKLAQQRRAMAEALGIPADSFVLFSAKTGLGRDLLWRAVVRMCAEHKRL